MTNRDWLLLGILAVIFGAAFYFIEIALEDVGVLLLVWSRVALAGLLLAGFAILRGERFPTAPGVWGLLFVMGFFNNALPFTLITWAQTNLTGGSTAVFMACAPLFTIVLAHFFTDDEKITGQRLLGLALGIGGVIILVGPGVLTSFDASSASQLAAIAGTFCYAIAGIVGKRLKHLTNTVAASSMLLCAAILWTPAVFILDSPFDAHWGFDALYGVIGVALVSTTVAYIIYYQLLRSVGASNMLLVTLLAPVSAITLGVLFLGEHVSMQMVGGAFVIGLGLAVIDGRPWRLLRARLSRAAA